jgi:hypothetical protein
LDIIIGNLASVFGIGWVFINPQEATVVQIGLPHGVFIVGGK